MNGAEKLLEMMYFGNSVRQYTIALGIFVALTIAFKIFEHRIVVRLKKWAKKTKTDYDDEVVKVIEHIPNGFYWFVSLYVGLQSLTVHEKLSKFLNAIFVIFIFYAATRIVTELIDFILKKMAKKKGEDKPERTSTYFALSLIAKLVLWSIALLLVLSNLGVNISALVASLGIGGIAIALAVQNILGDMFSSFSIYFDKPFEIGDFIIVGEHMGTVKKIGLKTTRITSLQGEELVISNHELTSTRVRNFKKMRKRRIVFGFGVTYSTKPEKLKKIPKIVTDLIDEMELTKTDRVHFRSFGDSSLDFEVVYYINSSVYNNYMDAQQQINLGIMEHFAKEGIEMAFPTRTVHMVK